ncbi:MAG: ATP-binding protein [Clostridiales bacterium]|nr:MAG: ATP-binding protein [Clostridiales bacterium]
MDIKECIKKLRFLKLGKTDVKIIADYNNDPWFSDILTVTKIADAIYNILINSLDAVRAAERDRVSLKISVFHEADWICVSVEDNGCGIPKENLKKCFNPLFTAKKNPRKLGNRFVVCFSDCHISPRICFFADSKVGEYTQFQILLPSIKKTVQPLCGSEKNYGKIK